MKLITVEPRLSGLVGTSVKSSDNRESRYIIEMEMLTKGIRQRKHHFNCEFYNSLYVDTNKNFQFSSLQRSKKKIVLYVLCQYFTEFSFGCSGKFGKIRVDPIISSDAQLLSIRISNRKSVG